LREITIGGIRGHQTFVAIVSDDDFAFLNNWIWSFARSHPGNARELIYARRAVRVLELVDGLKTPLVKRFDLFMHHVVLSRMGYERPPFPRWTADHINHNTLDNRRENLRWASPSFQAKRQRHRMHHEFVQQSLGAMLAEHTLPIVLDPPSIVGADAAAPAYAECPF
jgi:hypothetical protein